MSLEEICWRLSIFFTCALQQIAQVHSVKQYVSFLFSLKYKLHLKKSIQILLVLNVLAFEAMPKVSSFLSHKSNLEDSLKKKVKNDHHS